MWSKTKKQLEERLAKALVGKIEYTMAASHRLSGPPTEKITIRYMGEALLDFQGGLDYYVSYYESEERTHESEWTSEETHALYLKAQNRMWYDGIYAATMFFVGVRDYLSLSISDALKNEQWIIRLFAILDKRCGKRSLLRLAEQINEYPEPLRKAYALRLDSESIRYYYDDKQMIRLI